MTDLMLLPLMLLLHMLSSLWANARPLPEQADRLQQRAWLTLKALPLAAAISALLLSQGLVSGLMGFIVILLSQLILEHQRLTRPQTFTASFVLGQLIPRRYRGPALERRHRQLESVGSRF